MRKFVIRVSIAAIIATLSIFQTTSAGLFKDIKRAEEIAVIAKTAHAVERIEKKRHVIAENRTKGKIREKLTEAKLKSEHPGASVQAEHYLRNSAGDIAKDPLTGSGRRIDHVVIEQGKVIRKVETTSLNAKKVKQLIKERRIMESGGTHIRDRETNKLIDSGTNVSEVVRWKP